MIVNLGDFVVVKIEVFQTSEAVKGAILDALESVFSHVEFLQQRHGNEAFRLDILKAVSCRTKI